MPPQSKYIHRRAKGHCFCKILERFSCLPVERPPRAMLPDEVDLPVPSHQGGGDPVLEFPTALSGSSNTVNRDPNTVNRDPGNYSQRGRIEPQNQ